MRTRSHRSRRGWRRGGDSRDSGCSRIRRPAWRDREPHRSSSPRSITRSSLPGPAPASPRLRQQSGGDGVELADEPERERAQERPDRRWGHHLERQHRLGRTRTQHVDVIDVGSAGDHRCDQSADLAARRERPGPHPSVCEAFQTEPRTSAWPPRSARRWRSDRHDQRSHRTGRWCAILGTQKVPPVACGLVTSNITIIPAQEALLVDASTATPPPTRWIQAEGPLRRASRHVPLDQDRCGRNEGPARPAC